MEKLTTDEIDQAVMMSVLDTPMVELGEKIGRLYTDKGFPVDMALARMNFGKERKLSIILGVCNWLIQHKRNSGATEKILEKQRKYNREMTYRFMRTNETGAY